MQSKRGFTIIELIVVIAIIAILAAIVMVNVVQYINKSKDASVQANMDTIKTDAATYYADPDRGNGSYVGFATTNTQLASDFTLPQANVNKNDGGFDLLKYFHDDSYCASAPLLSAGGHWCIDSTGFTGSGYHCHSADNLPATNASCVHD